MKHTYLNTKPVDVRFTVVGNNNIYFATTYRSMTAFCNANEFEIDRYFYIQSASVRERNTAVKCGRGVYFIEANVNGIV